MAHSIRTSCGTDRYNSPSFLRQNLPKRPAAVRDGHGTAGAVGDGGVGVDAEAVVDGGADVGGADLAVADIGGMGVAGAAHGAAADAGARQHDRVAVRPVVAAGGGVDARRPAE